MDIKYLKEHLYNTFKKYKADNTSYCPCGCINSEDVKKLASKKLRDLNINDLIPYHGSALYTWGDTNTYKHYLPKILEIHHDNNGRASIGLHEIVSKLKYANWERWSQDEITSIKDFLFADWIAFINRKEIDLDQEDFENYYFFFNTYQLLNNWKLTPNSNGLRNFVYFIYANGTAIFNNKYKINIPDFTDSFKKIILNSTLIQTLEQEFFSIAETDKSYAQVISDTILLLEQEYNKA